MTLVTLAAALLVAQAAPAQPAPTTLPPAGPVLALDEALREAQARNLDLQVARERLEQSKELHWKAWSVYLPQVTASGSFTHNDFSDIRFPTQYAVANCGSPGCYFDASGQVRTDPNVPGPTTFTLFPVGEPSLIAKQDQLNAQLQATQALFAPQAWFGIASARAGERLAAESVEQARRDILFGVAQGYYAAAGLKQVVTIQERQLAIAVEHERDARVRYEAGTTPKVSLLRAEIDRATAEQDLKRAQNAYLSAKVAVATLLDRPDAAFEVQVPPSPQAPAAPAGELVDAALRDRPDVRAAAEQITVSDRSRQANQMRYLPTLAAFGRYAYTNAAGFSGENWSWAVGLALNWTLFDGGLRESDLREASSRAREARAAEAGARARARQEVAQAWLDLDSARANSAKAGERLALARENQRLVDVNYRAGAATYLEVSDANTALLQAELAQVSESLSADLAALRLLRAAGAFNPR